ncbi:MAG: hypothetical protein ACI86S_000665 [Paracoccaceae bacterium]|jgi:hypothetical protein
MKTMVQAIFLTLLTVAAIHAEEASANGTVTSTGNELVEVTIETDPVGGEQNIIEECANGELPASECPVEE